MMENYVPIYLDLMEPIGVIELYYNMDAVNKSIVNVNELVTLGILIMVLIIVSAIIIFLFNNTIFKESNTTRKFL